MKFKLFDLYSDYLLSSFSATTATGMSALMEQEISHDQISRMLNQRRLRPADWWQMVKPSVRSMQGEDGVITIDDSIIEKPYSDENELICWHYDHAQGGMVKGINFITALYTVGEVSLPVTYRLVSKTESCIDKQGKPKRRSRVTKNQQFRAMLHNCVRNRIPFRYVLNDIWFASAENMCHIKRKLGKEFIMGLKANRKVALSHPDKLHGRYHRLDTLDLPEDTVIPIYLEQVPFPLHLLRQSCTNADGSTAVRYLVTSDPSLTADQPLTIYQKRWKVEEYHRSLKQNASVAKSPTRTPTTQTNHFVAALWSFTKLEMLKVRTKQNYYTLKTHLYLSALQQTFHALAQLNPVRLEASTA
ncbi:MAG: transposase [Caldilineaceae bacterium SB0665_bin_25]|nr:transposase [Caldilineaceae bacterium SB0665_bin_25]